MKTDRARAAGRFFGFLGALLCVLGTDSCKNLGAASSGSIRIELSSAANRAIMLVPSISMDPAYFNVEGAGPGGATFSMTVQGASASSGSIDAGSWTITVTAFNLSGVEIGVGTASASVVGGQTASVTIVVLPISGTGNLSLIVTWPPAEIDADAVNATLEKDDIPVYDLSFGAASSGSASYSGSEIQNGYYQLKIRLKKNGSVIATEDSTVVRIVTGQTTSGTIAFGSTQPLTVSLTASATSKNVMESVLLTASVAEGGSPTYKWYVDDSLVTGSASAYTFGSTWHSGPHEVRVIATSSDGTRTGNATATITVTTAGATIGHANYDPASLSNEEVAAAAALDVYLEHASVGGNIVNGLVTLASAGRYTCERVRWGSSYPANASVPTWYDTHNGLGDNDRGNPNASYKISYFQESLSGSLSTKVDIAMFKFCFIDSPSNGSAFFSSVKTAMEGLESSHGAVTFVWWTMPINSHYSNAQRQTYNDLVRTYCSANDQWLFDVADLESHYDGNDDGIDDIAVIDADGRERLYTGFDDDGLGHLNATGQKKMALAYWRLIAEIAKTR